MANNRIAYGLANEYNINTQGMTPHQVWEALSEKGISVHGDVELKDKQNKIDELNSLSTEKLKELAKANDKSGAVELSIYVNSADDLSTYAKKIKKIDGYEDIIIHGSPMEFELRDLNDDVASIYTPKELAEILREDPNYHGGDIRLLSCEAGKGDNCAAQLLANELGVKVMAPTETLSVFFDGTIDIKNSKTYKKGYWKVFEPKKEKT